MCLSRKVVDQTCRVCHVLQWPCEQKNSLGPTSFFPEMLSNHLAMLWNMSAIHTHFSNNLSKKVLKFSSQISTIYSMHTVTSKLPPFLLPSLPLSLTLTTAPIEGSHTHVHHMSQEVHRTIHVRTTAELYKSRHRVKRSIEMWTRGHYHVGCMICSKTSQAHTYITLTTHVYTKCVMCCSDLVNKWARSKDESVTVKLHFTNSVKCVHKLCHILNMSLFKTENEKWSLQTRWLSDEC